MLLIGRSFGFLAEMLKEILFWLNSKVGEDCFTI